MCLQSQRPGATIVPASAVNFIHLPPKGLLRGTKAQARPLKLDLTLGCSTSSTARQKMICHLNLHLHTVFKKWKENDEAESTSFT